MRSFTGIAVARMAPGDDEMHSRLSTYLHPLAGRPLVWHTLTGLRSLDPPSGRLWLAAGMEMNADLLGEVMADFAVFSAAPAGDSLAAPPLSGPVLLVDAAAPAAAPILRLLIEEPEGTAVPAPDGRVAAALVRGEDAREILESGGGMDDLATRVALRFLDPHPAVTIVSDRRTLAFASRQIRDRTVERLMAGGVTFLLPETVLVDVDVRVGRDTIIYPGVVIEGSTTVGEETVIGPACRIIDSWIGSGVELKGWNFISRSSVRNRAILEPYVRRGFD